MPRDESGAQAEYSVERRTANSVQEHVARKGGEEKPRRLRERRETGEPGRTRTYNPLIKSGSSIVQDVHNVLLFQRDRWSPDNPNRPIWLAEWTLPWTPSNWVPNREAGNT